MQTIDIEEVAQAVDLILRHIRDDLDVSTIYLSEEDGCYWTVSRAAALNLDSPPNAEDIGLADVSESAEFLANMVRTTKDTSDAPALMLQHAAGLLNYLAARVKG